MSRLATAVEHHPACGRHETTSPQPTWSTRPADDGTYPERVRTGSVLRSAAWVLCLVAAGVGLVLLARTGEFDLPMLVLLGSDVVLALTLYAGPGALDPRFFPTRLATTVRPGLAAVAAQTVVGFAVFPLTHDGEDPDYSWFGVIPFVTVLGGLLAGLLAILAWVLLVAPVAVLVLRSPAAVRGDLAARQSVVYSVLLLAVTVLATAMTFADPDDGRASTLRLAGLLLGAVDAAAGQAGLVWVARAMVVVLVAGAALLVRTRRAITAAGGDPDAGVPPQNL